MRLWNDCVQFLLVLLIFSGSVAEIAAQSANPASQNPGASLPNSSPISATPERVSTPPSGSPVAVPPDVGAADKDKNQQPAPSAKDAQSDDAYVFRKEVDEVSLHATVMDEKDALITNLDRSAFSVFEDGTSQRITSFRHEDIPVSMGILIDNSGSMKEKREKINQAALNLVRSSNAQDEVFIVNFNDEVFLDQDFTSDIGKMKEALAKYNSAGGTALYDAVVGAADHLKRGARLEKKVLFVVTDGEDKDSRDSLEQAIQILQQEGGPTIYTIGLLGEEKQRRARRALQLLAQRTGGIAFFPKTLDEVDQISRTVAHDIRNQYSIGYKPSNPKSSGGYRQIHVEAKAHGYRKLTVRTKSGYYANPQPSN
jgi:VWFA-related protein